MSELESFVRDWEAAERSRHARLIEELKREVQAASKPVPAEAAIDVPYSLRLSPGAGGAKVKRDRQARSRHLTNRHELV